MDNEYLLSARRLELAEGITEELIDKHGIEHALDVAALEAINIDPGTSRLVGMEELRTAIREDRDWMVRLLGLRELRRAREECAEEALREPCDATKR